MYVGWMGSPSSLLDAGATGYISSSGIFFAPASVQGSHDALPLDYYRTYTTNYARSSDLLAATFAPYGAFNLSTIFSDPANYPCNDAVNAKYGLNWCTDGMWISPICQSNRSACSEVYNLRPGFGDSGYIEQLIRMHNLSAVVKYLGADNYESNLWDLIMVKGQPAMFYYWTPSPFLSQIPNTRVSFPAWTSGCDAGNNGMPNGTTSCDLFTATTVKMVTAWTYAVAPEAIYALSNGQITTAQQLELMRLQVVAGGQYRTNWGTACRWIKDNLALIQSWLLTCDDSHAMSSQYLRCVPICDPGSALIETTDSSFCEPCAAGTYRSSDAEAAILCPSCPDGYYSTQAGQLSCNRCPAGTFRSDTWESQHLNLTTDLIGQTCYPCPDGTFADASGSAKCAACPPDSYSIAGQTKTQCFVCPEGALCDTVEQRANPISAAGYYRFTNVPITQDNAIASCPRAADCLQNNQCTPLTEGIMCVKCMQQYTRQGSAAECKECPGKAVLGIQIAGLTLVVLILSALVVCPRQLSSLRFIKRAKTPEQIRLQHMAEKVTPLVPSVSTATLKILSTWVEINAVALSLLRSYLSAIAFSVTGDKQGGNSFEDTITSITSTSSNLNPFTQLLTLDCIYFQYKMPPVYINMFVAVAIPPATALCAVIYAIYRRRQKQKIVDQLEQQKRLLMYKEDTNSLNTPHNKDQTTADLDDAFADELIADLAINEDLSDQIGFDIPANNHSSHHHAGMQKAPLSPPSSYPSSSPINRQPPPVGNNRPAPSVLDADDTSSKVLQNQEVQRLLFDQRPWLRTPGTAVFIVINLFFHPTLSRRFLNVLHCEHWDVWRVAADIQIECSGASYDAMYTVAVASLMIWTYGAPLYMLGLLFYTRARRLTTSWRRKFGFLTGGYKRQFYWWEPYSVLRKVVVLSMFALPRISDRLILSTELVLAIMFLVIHVLCCPFDDRSYSILNRLEGLSLFAFLLTILGAYIVAELNGILSLNSKFDSTSLPYSDSARTGAIFLILAVVFMVQLLFIFAAAWTLFTHSKVADQILLSAKSRQISTFPTVKNKRNRVVDPLLSSSSASPSRPPTATTAATATTTNTAANKKLPVSGTDASSISAAAAAVDTTIAGTLDNSRPSSRRSSISGHLTISQSTLR